MASDTGLLTYINLKLAALGKPVCASTSDPYFLEIAGPLLRNHHQKDQILGSRLCPADARIQFFLDSYLSDVCPGSAPKLPVGTFVLDRPGLARAMSLPANSDTFVSPYGRSYRVAQGVLHNPNSDRRTTHGIFHIAEGGLPIPADKIAAPKAVFARMLELALKPPQDALTLPFTADQPEQAKLYVSLLLRPIVCPATATEPQKTMEVRFFAPASLVSNLDFVESIFGNGGDPFLPENDAALDVEHWTGHTGCVIVAPHLAGVLKKDLGLPYEKETDAYNEGRAFKLACRDHRGVMVTIIADSYFGYCKKEVKTQISFAANLFGLCEEEHAGGAIAYPTYILGQEFYAGRTVRYDHKASFEGTLQVLGENADAKPEGYAVDRNYPDILYVPENSVFSVRDNDVRWQHNDQTQHLTLKVGHHYVLPSGYKIHLEKQLGGSAWRLVGSGAEGTLCHKPCTVSGGGKSEISKSIAGALLQGSVFVRDYRHDMDVVAGVLGRDYSNIFKTPPANNRAKRPILGAERSLGSVIKLLTPSDDYTDEYNAWLKDLPQTIRQLVFTIKRYYRPEWGQDWRAHFTVDRINGYQGHELKYNNQRLVGNYLRVGYDPEGAWRIYKLRPDFHPADKVQVEDDITASVVLPRESLTDLNPLYENPSVKLVQNCERMLFQRPDDAAFRGVDKQAEADIASPQTFLSNFEPLTLEDARAEVDRVVEFDQYTEPMHQLLEDFVADPKTEFIVSSARARLVDGKPSKNPRYLQRRPDLMQAKATYLAEIGTRLYRQIPAGRSLYSPVNAVLSGRRNNPPEPAIGLPPLAVYNPIHYQELPELFMEYVASLTGKSPSTTGFGSEGALTKGPFNAVWPIVDLNNAVTAAILTGYAGFTTAAGHVGPHYKVDHDITMVVPEVWCRMRVHEREARFLIDNGYLEKLEDFEYEGRPVLASRLGYRITRLFADRFFGRIFETPDTIFPEELLRPEKQDLASFVEGVQSIESAQANVARQYFEDGSAAAACPPLHALLHIMAYGSYEGCDVSHPSIRALFTRESLLSSDWYQERLRAKQQRDVALWARHVSELEDFQLGVQPFCVGDRLALARQRLDHVRSEDYLRELAGTIGADPFKGQL